MKEDQKDVIKNLDEYEMKFNGNKTRLSEVRVEKAKRREKELESKYQSIS